MKFPVYIRHKVGWCPVCGAPVLDAGWTDDPAGWAHSMPDLNKAEGWHFLGYGACAMVLSR